MSAGLIGPFDPAIYVSLAFFFGIAAQFRAMDGYSFLRRILASIESRVGLVFAVALVTFVFSPFILNDVLVLILTPAIIKYAKQHGLDAAPLIVAEITFTNISSSLTPIGNPQNILLWTASGVSFTAFIEGTWLPVLLSAAIAAVAMIPLARLSGGERDLPSALGPLYPVWYLVYVTAVVLASDALGFPSYIPLAVAFAGGFAFNRGRTAAIVREFDVRSLLTLSIFVAATAVAAYFLAPWLAPYVDPAAQGQQPYSGVFIGLVSNAVSNVPTTQLLVKVSGVSAALAPKIAVEAGLAGNLGPIASFANLLALQMAAKNGVSVRRTVGLQFVVGVFAFIPALV